MKSYASVDKIEGSIVVCEVELCPIEDSKTDDYTIKGVTMIEVPLTMFYDNFEEGDIFVVEHDFRNISKIICKDDEEKQRRIDVIQNFMLKL